VAFVRNGQIVDELLDCIISLTEGMKAMLTAIEILEKKVDLLQRKQTIIEQFTNVRIVNNER
jgi:hypothetical protein